LGSQILCFQEADYMPLTDLPKGYESAQSTNRNISLQRIAWDSKRFELVQNLGDTPSEKGFIVVLFDKVMKKNVAIATGHLNGCNPFQEEHKKGKSDSLKGDKQLTEIVEHLDKTNADLRIVAMDANVTTTHPRLRILPKEGYRFDARNFVEPTCPNPYFITNLRLDHIAVKGGSIEHKPVAGTTLNELESCPSDHKPVVAKIRHKPKNGMLSGIFKF
jgi:hypothetical protein